MSYLTGKRFKSLLDGKKGVIVSEAFKEKTVLADDDPAQVEWKMCVGVVWEDGTMDSRIDIETLKLDIEDSGYVVVVNNKADKDGEIVLETYLKFSSLMEAEKRVEYFTKNGTTCRIAKINFTEGE